MEAKRGFVELEVRKGAMGEMSEIEDEPGFKKICQNVEELYGAKKIVTSGDWLACHKELGQTFEEFRLKPDRNKIDKNRNKIYLLIADQKIDSEVQEKLLKYCKAFYSGVHVEMI